MSSDTIFEWMVQFYKLSPAAHGIESYNFYCLKTFQCQSKSFMCIHIMLTQVPLSTVINKKNKTFTVEFVLLRKLLVRMKSKDYFFHFMYKIVKNHYKKLPLRVKLC